VPREAALTDEADDLHARAGSWTNSGRYYVLAVLCVIGVFNQLDRQIISVVLQPIKMEFGASDKEMGFVTGTLFALFYALAALPVARLLDRRPRKQVLAVCLTFWSLMTTLGGVVSSLTQLAVTRTGIAAAEAGAAPSAYSILSDLFKLGGRATAIATYTGSQSVGIGLGIFLGGWLSDVFGWRASFMIVGVPGLLLAAVLLLTVREPVRGQADGLVRDPEPMSTWEGLKALMAIPTYRWILATVGLCGFIGYGMFAWGPTLLIRVHHLSRTVVGVSMGGAIAAALLTGNLLSGYLGDRFGRRDVRAYMWIAALGPLASVVPSLVFVSCSDWRVAVAAVFATQFLLTFHIPGSYAMAQTIVPLRARALASMLMGLASTLVGTGLAPLLIGVLNDFLQPRFGDETLRYSMATIGLSAAAAAVTAFMASRTLRKDFSRRTQVEAAPVSGAPH